MAPFIKVSLVLFAKTHGVLRTDDDPHHLTWRRAIEICTKAEIETITLTVTEKGYCYQSATGDVDWDGLDFQHDLSPPFLPRSVPGFLLAVLVRRA